MAISNLSSTSSTLSAIGGHPTTHQSSQANQKGSVQKDFASVLKNATGTKPHQTNGHGHQAPHYKPSSAAGFTSKTWR